MFPSFFEKKNHEEDVFLNGNVQSKHKECKKMKHKQAECEEAQHKYKSALIHQIA